MTTTSGQAPMRKGKEPPMPADTLRTRAPVESAAGSRYTPYHSRYIQREGEKRPIRNCMAWVWPERVS